MTTSITIHPEPRYSSPAQAGKAQPPSVQHNDDFFGSFADLLDVVNPLQHIPGISTLYREVTGDTISTGAKIAGDTLFGGIAGLFASIAGAIFEQQHGQDIGSSLYAAATHKYDKTANLS